MGCNPDEIPLRKYQALPDEEALSGSGALGCLLRINFLVGALAAFPCGCGLDQFF